MSDEIPECEICGCSEFDPCTDRAGRPCHWVKPGLCSVCAAEMGEPILVLPGSPEYAETLEEMRA